VVDRVPSTAYACKLRYEVTVKPKLSVLIPSDVVAAIMRTGLPINLRAVGARAEQLAAEKAAAPKFAQLETLQVGLSRDAVRYNCLPSVSDRARNPNRSSGHASNSKVPSSGLALLA
jgi:hypothetical protein